MVKMSHFIFKFIFNSHCPTDRLKRSYERLKRSQWRQYNDFLPLLSISESVIRRIQKNDSREIRKRIYMFSECFSVSGQMVIFLDFQLF